MEVDQRYYLQVFCTQHHELRADVVDYFMAFMRKRNSINRGINVEQIRKHCEYIIKKEIPMDYFLGALELCAGMLSIDPLSAAIQASR